MIERRKSLNGDHTEDLDTFETEKVPNDGSRYM